MGGSGQPVVFNHGWPLPADDWDTQLLFFLRKGYRVIADDRRGHGRSTQTADGHDMDHYTDDLAALTAHLDLKNAIYAGHSTGGGEVTCYLGRHGESRVAKAAPISAVPPLIVKKASIRLAFPKRYSTICRRNSIGTCRQGFSMATTIPAQKPPRPSFRIGGAKARWGVPGCIMAFSQKYFTDEPRSAKLLKNGTLKTYKASRTVCLLHKQTRATPICWRSSISRTCGSRTCMCVKR